MEAYPYRGSMPIMSVTIVCFLTFFLLLFFKSVIVLWVNSIVDRWETLVSALPKAIYKSQTAGIKVNGHCFTVFFFLPSRCHPSYICFLVWCPRGRPSPVTRWCDELMLTNRLHWNRRVDALARNLWKRLWEATVLQWHDAGWDDGDAAPTHCRLDRGTTGQQTDHPSACSPARDRNAELAPVSRACPPLHHETFHFSQ